VGELSVNDVREFMAKLTEAIKTSNLAAKTVNNALGTLVVCLNAAVEDGLLAVNPALRVERLPDTSSATTCDLTRSRCISMGAAASTVRWPIS
jgi:hypothetical protein